MKQIAICLVSLFLFSSAFSQTGRSSQELIEQATAVQDENVADVERYVKSETVSGKLDFSKLLENEKTFFFLHENVVYNKKDFAIFLWSKKVKQLGIGSSKKAIKIWQEVNKRELTVPEKKALENGFSS